MPRLSQDLQSLNGDDRACFTPLTATSLLSLEQKAKGQAPEPAAYLHLFREPVLKALHGSVKIFCEITYLQRVSLFQRHKTEILEIDVTTFVMN